MYDSTPVERRALLRGAALGTLGLGLGGLFPAWAQSGTAGLAPALPTLAGPRIDLRIGHSDFRLMNRTGHAVTVNGTLPAPLLRLKEGQNVQIAVTNRLHSEDTSIHWHGLLLPFQMDGVPGVSFPGIGPGETFLYDFPVKQSGTYWYHSHSGLQEQQGLYGPIVIDPAEADPVVYDREHVIVLSDWTFLHPHELIEKLKKSPGYFNRNRQTLTSGSMSQSERLMWGRMRMDPTDISDVTGATYTYLVNGHAPEQNWRALFRPGERVRLRIINAGAMTIFNVRIPGLPMTVVSSDGQNVRPVTVDEFQIGNAETYDVLVQPTEDRAFTFVAEAIDRSGMARATLAPRMGMAAPVPPLREKPILGMKDMGMGMDHAAMGHTGVDHGSSAGMSHDMRDKTKIPPHVEVGVGTDMIAPNPGDRTGEPGLGIEDAGHRGLS